MLKHDMFTALIEYINITFIPVHSSQMDYQVSKLNEVNNTKDEFVVPLINKLCNGTVK